MLDRSDKNGPLYLVSDLGGKVSVFLPLSIILVIGFWCDLLMPSGKGVLPFCIECANRGLCPMVRKV